MSVVKIAVVSFPGNNCEVESIRALKRAGIEPVFFRWNDDISLLEDIDGYFIPGGFSYEDRGRAGMVAARDPLLDYIGREAEAGKVVIGNCNGAQILVESGIIPLEDGLRMSLAPNVINEHATGFINEWVWVKPNCAKDRCATSDWSKPIHMPLAHGEGRFTTKDKDVLHELEQNNQLAFRYCSSDGKLSDDPYVAPNGSVYAAAGICNPAGNVVALMPHPERTINGDPYFASVKKWIESKKIFAHAKPTVSASAYPLQPGSNQAVEILIETIITNNEERTVEQAARRIIPALELKQYRYLAPSVMDPAQLLSNIALFNPNKEKAYIRRHGAVFQWDADSKTFTAHPVDLLKSLSFLRVDEPDTGALAIGGGVTGVCYVCTNCEPSVAKEDKLLEIFANPHASRLELLSSLS